jgi:hypothetical protein
MISTTERKTIRILSCDGGGIAGIATCKFLYHLDKYLLENGSSLFDFFDMFVGTSTGSLIISAIAYNKMTGDDLINVLYTSENAQKIMDPSEAKRDLHMLEGRPKFDGKGKTEILQKYLGDTLLGQSNGKDVVIPVFKVAQGPNNIKEPHLFRSWITGTDNSIIKPKNSDYVGDDSSMKVVDVCNMSSAAPVYFPSVETNNIQGIDGGVFVNNPTECAYAQALKKYGADADIRVLSIGTGFYDNDQKIGLNWGPEQWLIKGDILSLLMKGPQEMVHYNMIEFADALNHTYIRVNGPIKDSSLDNVTNENIDRLLRVGTEWWYTQKNDVLSKMIDNYKTLKEERELDAIINDLEDVISDTSSNNDHESMFSKIINIGSNITYTPKRVVNYLKSYVYRD